MLADLRLHRMNLVHKHSLNVVMVPHQLFASIDCCVVDLTAVYA